MAGVLRIAIEESAETLKTLLDKQHAAVSRSKVQVLWWLKTGVVTSVNHLAQLSGYHRTTVSRWLSEYRQGGLGGLASGVSEAGSHSEDSRGDSSALGTGITRSRRLW
ncbi:helix-turn-helix domain-containing protein [Phormidium sp. FACHB-322]|uniref:helix-turn-helix domain-containing protein n=1 Tax=Cyanophyceae TaxID=3028117 RepID=UPI0016853916|nr:MULTISPECIES: helix-turn-helix domain-containing protein [Cyanophyceae]MBD1916454.1 helix-turn-helix domain-containing protein [Phormidium sp. FACHB-77]MBD2029693.1 helix-turn-helix domain-containing protein [Phormidium sp. FACHB-322]MBD2049596.1 helix-turn-helix domain-containing protein [Leptolyngbya sp. FACHB-60]